MPKPPNPTTSMGVRGTNSEIRGLRPSVRLPSRTVPIWVRLPTGRERPVRMASTPAMKVVATAPIPGRSTPSFPSAGLIGRPFSVVVTDVPPGGPRRRDPKKRCYHTRGRRAGRRRRSGTRKTARIGEKDERGRGQLAVVARPHEPPLPQVVVEDPGAGEVFLGIERIEHQDAAFAGKAAVVEKTEREI